MENEKNEGGLFGDWWWIVILFFMLFCPYIKDDDESREEIEKSFNEFLEGISEFNGKEII